MDTLHISMDTSAGRTESEAGRQRNVVAFQFAQFGIFRHAHNSSQEKKTVALEKEVAYVLLELVNGGSDCYRRIGIAMMLRNGADDLEWELRSITIP